MTFEATPEEIQRAYGDRDYWQRFGELFDWKLTGWSCDWAATFLLPPDYQQTIEITRTARTSIMKRFRGEGRELRAARRRLVNVIAARGRGETRETEDWTVLMNVRSTASASGNTYVSLDLREKRR